MVVMAGEVVGRWPGNANIRAVFGRGGFRGSEGFSKEVSKGEGLQGGFLRIVSECKWRICMKLIFDLHLELFPPAWCRELIGKSS